MRLSVLVLFLTLSLPPNHSFAVDRSVLVEFKERAAPFSQLTEKQYQAALKQSSHPIRGLRRSFAQFMMSTEIEAPDQATALAWREALLSPLVQQFGLEWVARAFAQAEMKILAGESDEENPWDRAQRELHSTRDALNQALVSIQEGKLIPAELIGRLKGPPPPGVLSKTCEPLVRAVRLLGHLAPETIRETLGIEHVYAELMLAYLEEGTKTGNILADVPWTILQPNPPD